MSADNTWTIASGATLYAGCAPPVTGRPAWRTEMAAGTVRLVPGNTLASINPENDPAINPNHPSPSPWKGDSGQVSMIRAYGGFCYDDATATLWAPLQEGHTDGGSNAPYKNCLNVASADWSMLRNPSGAIGNVINLKDGAEASGVYADGRLRAVHAYGNNIYVPGVGPVMSRLAGFFYSGQVGADKAYKLNETTGEATLLVDYTSIGSQLGTGYGGAAYDSLRNCIWNLGVLTARLLKIDVATWSASALMSSDNYAGGNVTLQYMPEHDLLAVLHNGGSGYPPTFYLIDLTPATPVKIIPVVNGTMSAGLDPVLGHAGAGWDGARLLLWNNATSRNEISTLTPTGNPRTQPWTAGIQSFTGVAVSAATPNGPHGCFGYSEKLGGCYLLNATTEQTHFFATE